MTWTLSAFADEAGASSSAQIAAIKRADLKYVDIRSIDEFNVAELPLDRAREIKHLLDGAGIKVGMFGSPLGKIDIADDHNIDLNKLRHMGDLAPVLGCRNVRIFSYFNAAGVPEAQWEQTSIERLGALRDLARGLDLVLYHENEQHIFGDSCARVATIARELRDPASFRMIFDFDNYLTSGEDCWETWLKLRDVTDGFHLKDSIDGKHVPAGQGAGCVRAILADALARHWNGALAVEPHLTYSDAVMVTGPTGTPNQAYAAMSTADSFHAAVQEAKSVLAELAAPVE